MRALSLRQPWAWAVAHAGKRLENRNWKWLHRGYAAFPEHGPVAGARVAIHASKARPRPDDIAGVMAAASLTTLPAEAQRVQAIVATCRIVDVVRCAEPREVVAGSETWPKYRPREDDVRRVWELFGVEQGARQTACWWLGPFALVLDDVIALDVPVGCGGALGFWQLPTAVEIAVRMAEDRERRAQESA